MPQNGAVVPTGLNIWLTNSISPQIPSKHMDKQRHPKRDVFIPNQNQAPQMPENPHGHRNNQRQTYLRTSRRSLRVKCDLIIINTPSI
jgi:hypothetical protein